MAGDGFLAVSECHYTLGMMGRVGERMHGGGRWGERRANDG